MNNDLIIWFLSLLASVGWLSLIFYYLESKKIVRKLDRQYTDLATKYQKLEDENAILSIQNRKLRKSIELSGEVVEDLTMLKYQQD